MKIVFFDFVTHYGGAVRSTVELASRISSHADVAFVDVYGSCIPFCNALRHAGIEHRSVCFGSNHKFVGGRGPLSRLWRLLFSLPHLIRTRIRLKKAMQELGPSLILTNNFKSALVVASLGLQTRVPLAIYLRGWYRPQEMPLWGRWLCHHATGLIALSRATKAALTCSGIDHRKIHVLHNAIDVPSFVSMAQRPISEALPQISRPVRLLLPADVIRSKGQHTAIMALRKIIDLGHDAVLWLAGEHAWPVGRNRGFPQEAQAMAECLGVADRVVWLGRRDDMPQVMAAASIVVFPSETEGLGRVLLEALALAKPVAAAAAGGITDVIAHGITGLLFEIGDVEDMAGCVARFLSEPDFARKVGMQGQQYVIDAFSPEQQVTRAASILRSLAHEIPVSGRR
jgi:glycosyltransferase involved in cell wall biosynthesis